jgi:RNA polymerase sigma factor (sigma-70 family)
MMTTQTMSVTECNDAGLVTQSMAGNRNAFGQIVAQHQSLICSLAYSATGSLTQSQDIAQETFVTAWIHLPELREPARLRAWLCGIARNLIGKTLRRDAREPVHAAEQLEEPYELPSQEPLPSEHLMSKEEEAILWRSLERIPEAYREPLVLFYRERQSVERVAEALELTPEAVKQRLSRGRKLLQEQVLAFVEGALEQTSPGNAFTLGVLAALPEMTTSAKAAAVGAAAVKGSAVAKSAGFAGFASAVPGTILMFLSFCFWFRLDRDSARSPQMRDFVIKCWRIIIGCIAVFMLAMFSLMLCGWPLAVSRPGLFAGLFIGLGIAYILIVSALNVWMMRRRRTLRQQDIAGSRPVPILVPLFEYRSKLSLFGLPFVHIRLRGGLERGPVKAWIAGGDSAIGAVFAFGAVAIAPISFGGFAVGLLTFGGFAIGGLSLGGFCLGLWAIGGMAVGWQAFGGCAMAWLAAHGGVAIAHNFAVGGVALGRYANDAPAEAFIRDSRFFQNALAGMRYAPWLNFLWLVPPALWWWSQQKSKRKRLNENT